MNKRAELLLDGPRGRRFCLELAMGMNASIRNASFRLALELAPRDGTVLVSTSDAGGPPTPAVSLDELKAQLGRLNLTQLSALATESALRAAVDTARYWQEPDGEDVLAALPEIREALAPLAQKVVALSCLQWFWEPRRVEQWSIDWRSAADPAPLPREPAQTLAKWARETRMEEMHAAKERPRDPQANWSGSWWSIPHRLIQTVGHMPAGLSLVEDSLGWEEATTIPVRGVGRTYEVAEPSDWVSLCRQFPLEVTASRRHDWFRVTGRDGRWVIPDWEKVAGEWDAVHLTVLGYLSTATCAWPVDAERSTVLGGWDPDSTIWLTDVAREWEGPRQTRRRLSGDETWNETS